MIILYDALSEETIEDGVLLFYDGIDIMSIAVLSLLKELEQNKEIKNLYLVEKLFCENVCYEYDVEHMPTIITIRNNKITNRLVGFKNKKEIELSLRA